MIKSDKKILLKHGSGWCIAVEVDGFPSTNYLVFKADTDRYKLKLPKSNVAYYGSLENALNRLFSQLIIEHSLKNKDYCGTLQDLRRAIDDAKKDFKQLLKPKKDDIIIQKHTLSAFSDYSGLERVLEQNKIGTLIMTGVCTDACVNDTMASGFEKGYHIIVPRDLVATDTRAWRQTLHRILLDDQWPILKGQVCYAWEILDSLYKKV